MLSKLHNFMTSCNKLKRILSLAVLSSVLLLPSTVLQALELRSVKTLDPLRSSRDKFSSSERITFKAETYSDSDAGKINFTFNVYDSVNKKVFSHVGNSIPGTTGNGGSEIASVPISQFYTSPGNYRLEVTATPGAGAAVTGSQAFSIYSPIITLLYPGNGAKDLIDQPLTFRWVASGASKYRIYIGDNQAFYNAMLIQETFDTFFSYPQNPTDTRQKLVSGQVYYWKVEGIDAAGNKVASSQVPFSFSVKSEGGSNTSDVAITAIALGGDIGIGQVPIDVTVKNQGGRIESNITLTLYVSGMVYGTYKVDFLNVNETKVINFKIDPSGLAPGQPLFVSVTHDLFDSNIQNNIFTAVIKLKQDIFAGRLAKILGKISEAKEQGEGKGIDGVKVTYEGPKAGEILSGEGGQYKIEGLPIGTYQLKTAHPAYKEAKREISVEEAKPYTNVDFVLERKESKQYTLDEIWAMLQERLSSGIMMELEGYELSEIKGISEKDLFAYMDQLKAGKAKITEAKIEY